METNVLGNSDLRMTPVGFGASITGSVSTPAVTHLGLAIGQRVVESRATGKCRAPYSRLFRGGGEKRKSLG
jgi:hypothetical protein